MGKYSEAIERFENFNRLRKKGEKNSSLLTILLIDFGLDLEDINLAIEAMKILEGKN